MYNYVLSADEKSHPSKERSFRVSFLRKNVLDQQFIVQEKNRSLFMLQNIIFYNWSQTYLGYF